MVCPNKNSKEWKDLVNKWSEEKALQMWQYDSDMTLEGEDTEIKDAIYYQVSENPDYFSTKYKSYLSNILGKERFTTKEMVEAFYARIQVNGGKLQGDVVVTNSGNYTLFPIANVDYVAPTNIPSDMERSLERLQSKFKVPFTVINEPSVKWKGKFVNDGTTKRVYINVAHATMDTPFHEYYHPFVRMLLMRNPAMFEAVLAEARNAGDNRPDEEEVVTTFLGKQAVSRKPNSIFQSFLNFLRRIFLKKDIEAYSTLNDVMNALNQGVDVSGETTLTEAYDKIDELIEDAAKAAQLKKKEKPNILDKLVQAAKKYTTSDESNFYQDELGRNIAIRLTAFIGDKDLGEFSSHAKKFKLSMAEYIARQEWAQLKEIPVDYESPRSALSGTVKIQGGEINFEQLLNYHVKILEKARIKGKLVHSFLQFAFEEDPAKKIVARNQAIEYAKQYGEPFTKLEEHGEIKKIWENIEQIALDVNLAVNVGDSKKYSSKFKDRIAPEVTIVSDIITDSNDNKIGTTADGIVEHFNGDLSLIDWKTGFITKDMHAPYFIKYGAKFGLNDSKLTRAYLELAFRALLIKEKHPEAKFREIKIVQIDREGVAHNMRLELAPYLATIAEYYKQTNPKLYEQLIEKKLLDAEEYLGTSQSLLEIETLTSHLAPQDRLAYLKTKLATLHQGKTKEQIQKNPYVKRLTIKYTEAILELEKIPGVDLNESTPDLPYLIGGLKNLSDINNPKVQTFHKALLKSKDQVAKEKKAIFDEHDALMRELEKEHPSRSNKYVDLITSVAATVGIATFNPWLFGIALVGNKIIKRFNIKTKDFWAFMWTKGKDGYYMNMGNTYMLNGEVKQMTPAQIKYRDFMRRKMESEYFAFANEVVQEDRLGRYVTRARALRIPETLPEGFIPRVPKQFDEVRENEKWYQNGLGIASAAKFQTRKYLTSFVENNFDNVNTPIPFSFFHHTDSPVVTGELHTFDAEVAFKSFMTNMIYKKHMDSMYDLAIGLTSALSEQENEEGTAKYPNLVEFVDKVIYPQVLGKTRAIEMRTKKWKFTPNVGVAKFLGIREGIPITVSQDRVMRFLKSSVTMMTLGFRVFGPIRNALMISLVTTSQTSKKPINQALSWMVGVPPDAFDKMDPSAVVELRGYYKNLLTGTLEESKLWNLATRFNWLPDEIPGVVPPDHLLAQPVSVSFTSHAYMLYQLGEVGGALWQLAALMKGTKVRNMEGKEVSLWDAYDKKGNWTLGARGVVENSDGSLRKLEELDELEIKTLKRINERLNGSYRAEERTALEGTIIGEFIFQFKKYFYQFLKVNFGNEYKDITYGKYVLDNSAPAGMPKYKWMAEALEGRVYVLAKSLWILMSNGTNGWKKLKTYLTDSTVASTSTAKNARVRALAEALNTALWMGALMAVFFSFYDDEEEKSAMGKDAWRIIMDLSRGLHPQDIFETAKKPIVGAQRLSEVGDSMFKFMFSGILRGKETQDGWIVGSKTLLRATPYLGSRMQLIDRMSEYDIESDPLLNFAR